MPRASPRRAATRSSCSGLVARCVEAAHHGLRLQVLEGAASSRPGGPSEPAGAGLFEALGRPGRRRWPAPPRRPHRPGPTGTRVRHRRRARPGPGAALVPCRGPRPRRARVPPPGRTSSAQRRSRATGSPPMPTLPSRSRAVPHRPSPGRGRKTERCEDRRPPLDGLGRPRAQGRVDAERDATLARPGARPPGPGPQPMSRTGSASRSSSAVSCGSGRRRHRSTSSGIVEPSTLAGWPSGGAPSSSGRTASRSSATQRCGRRVAKRSIDRAEGLQPTATASAQRSTSRQRGQQRACADRVARAERAGGRRCRTGSSGCPRSSRARGCRRPSAHHPPSSARPRTASTSG